MQTITMTMKMMITALRISMTKHVFPTRISLYGKSQTAVLIYQMLKGWFTEAFRQDSGA